MEASYTDRKFGDVLDKVKSYAGNTGGWLEYIADKKLGEDWLLMVKQIEKTLYMM